MNTLIPLSTVNRYFDSDSPPLAGGIGKSRAPQRDLGLILALTAAVLVAGFALWYTSAGNFPVFPNIQNDYVDLGNSFTRGKLWLLESPDPQLAELGNPYDYSQRKDIPYHWDASYYEGKYYLYWGPIPGLISAALQAMGGAPPSASVLVVLPYIGLLGVVIALLWHLSTEFGPAARLTVWAFVFMGFFNLPMLFTIGQPRHYQASIMYGQFFLLAALLGIVLYMRGRRLLWLPISGLALGFAFASRYNLAISIAAYLAAAAFWLWRDRAARSLGLRLGILLAPLMLCLLGLGLYNEARFGNPLETGLSYQLTIPEFRQISYASAYVPSGLYIYLLYPLTGSQSFPFIQDAHFSPRLLPESLFIPPGREFDQIAFGLVPSVPALWLFALALPLIGAALLRRRAQMSQPPHGASPSLVLAVLAAGAIGQFTFLLVFFYVAERYLVDFYLPAVLCLAIIVWYVQRAVNSRRVLQVALWAALSLVTIWTAAIGYFACFGVPVLVSIYYDPQMLAHLAAFWNGCFAFVRSVILVGG